MKIYPAIDIKDGKCVRLCQGKFDNVTEYAENPVLIAKKWEEKGASFIHVVDLDGALKGTSVNSEILKEIVNTVNIPVQTGGGIRTLEDIKFKIELGVSRVIIGTAAIENEEMIKEAVKLYKDKIAVGIDAKDGYVALEGWEKISSVRAVDLCVNMKEYGVKTFIYTDISKDGMLLGPNIEATKELVDLTGINVIGSGGVASKRDLEKFEKIGVEGVIIGKALYNENLKLEDVITCFERG